MKKPVTRLVSVDVNALRIQPRLPSIEVLPIMGNNRIFLCKQPASLEKNSTHLREAVIRRSGALCGPPPNIPLPAACPSRVFTRKIE